MVLPGPSREARFDPGFNRAGFSPEYLGFAKCLGWRQFIGMLFRRFILFFGLLMGAARLVAEETNDLPKGVEVRSYTGWAESVFLNSAERPVQAVIVPVIGGRIVHYSLNGQNILFENAASQGKSLRDFKNSPQMFWVGGYQCDAGPEIRGLEAHPFLFSGPHHWKPAGDFSIRTHSEVDSVLGVKLEKEIVIDPDSGDLGITQRMVNETEHAVSYCLWDRTLCKGGGFAFFPLNKKSRFKAGWSIRVKAETNFVYEGNLPYAPQVQVMDGVLVAEAVGDNTKVGADSDAGWVAYARGKLLFVKYFPFTAGGNYSDGGNSVEVYFDQRVVELEPLSPETKLEPQQNFSFAEAWKLIALDKEVTTAEEARALVKRVPESPFLRKGKEVKGKVESGEKNSGVKSRK